MPTHGEFDAATFQRLSPGQHILIDPSYQCAVEIEQKYWPVSDGFHSLSPFRIVVIENQAEHYTISAIRGTHVSIMLPFVPK
jgi:hypothetical protein